MFNLILYKSAYMTSEPACLGIEIEVSEIYVTNLHSHFWKWKAAYHARFTSK